MSTPAGTPGARPPSRPRGPLALYGAILTVLVVVIGAITFTVSAAPPPTIAEFAPDAVQQIKQANKTQSSSSGQAPGGAEGRATASPTPSARASVAASLPPEKVVPRSHQCFGEPARQTEDPQSPPCVPYWAGNNGGATTRGVTANTIRIAMPEGAKRLGDGMAAYVNKRFELYGRRIEFVSEGGTGTDCAERKAAAAQVEASKVFAVTISSGGASQCFHGELARRHVISVTEDPNFTEKQMAALHPYLWQYMMGIDRQFAGIGDMFCARLAGKNATHAGDASLQSAPRKIGVLLQSFQRDDNLSIAPLEKALARCGQKVAVFERQQDNNNADVNYENQVVVRMKQERVSTLICLCVVFLENGLGTIASAQGYHPEWILSSYYRNDSPTAPKLFWPSDQRQNIMDVSFAPRERICSQEWAYLAMTEVDPTYQCDTANHDGSDYYYLVYFYRTVLLIASGIQLAGPHLTPETFASGLQGAQFANPLPDPTGSGAVGFLDKDHGMTNDGVESWWSESANAPTPNNEGGTPQGSFCYTDRGLRRTPGRWTRGPDLFFRGPCYSGRPA